MSWFDGIKEGTLIRIELDNSKKMVVYFSKVSNGIVYGKLEDGRIKRFKEDKIEDLEELDSNEEELIEDTPISQTSQEIIQNIIQNKKLFLRLKQK